MFLLEGEEQEIAEVPGRDLGHSNVEVRVNEQFLSTLLVQPGYLTILIDDGCEILNHETSAIYFSNRLQGNRTTYIIPMLSFFYVQL